MSRVAREAGAQLTPSQCGSALVFLCMASLSSRAAAHPLDVAALSFSVEAGVVEGALDLGVPLARSLVEAGSALDPGPLFLATLGSGPLVIDEQRCTLQPTRVAEVGQRVELRVSGTCPGHGGELRWQLPFIDRGPPSFRLLVHAELDGVPQERVLEGGDSALVLSGPSQRGFGQFVLMGIEHIGAWPSEWAGPRGLRLPEGIDHILFLLALLLSGVQLVPVLATVTGFTVGHSITLSLATLGIVQLPSRLVESAIALSIAYVAAEDLIVKKPRPRWQIAAAFGLIHGFGFAKALAGLHLPRSRLFVALFGFNLGVEIGQEMIVAVAAPALWLLFKWPPFRRFGAPACACGILAAALFWFVKRAFL